MGRPPSARRRASLFLDPAVPVLLHVLFRRGFERTDDSEAEELGVGVIPDALRELGILDFPVGVGGAACCDSELFGGIIVPSASASGVRVWL